jgi:hypothetical protein
VAVSYPRIVSTRKTGAEPFHEGGHKMEFDVLGFWRWSASDLLSNATRGRLAEYLVARAIDIDVDSTVRDEWDACDLHSPSGLKIEVKSAAYLQSWYQRAPSIITFKVPKTRAWDAETNALASEKCRQAGLYVFALLAHVEKESVDPLDLEQWRFYVVPTAALDARTRSQHSITLRSLEQLTRGVSFAELRSSVEAVGAAISGRSS